MQQPQTIAVIGAGVIGICCALSLQKQGFAVTLIDRKGIAKECSYGNAGHFATEQVFPLADKRLLMQLPSMLLNPTGPLRIRWSYLLRAMPWFMRFAWNMRSQRFRRHTQALKALNQLALPAYDELLAEAGLIHLLEKNGSLLTFEDTKPEQIKREFEAFKAEGVKLQWLDRQQALALEPALSERVRSAFFFEEVGHSLDPEHLCLSLAKHFIALGGRLLEQDVLALEHHQHGVKVRSQAGSQEFNKALLCAGAWSKKLLAPLRYKVPLDTERGYHLMLPVDNPISRPVASAERKFIMTPMSGGLRLAGTVEFAGLEREMDNRRADCLLPHAKALLKDLPDTQMASRWMGMRPSLPDSLPVLGQAPNHPHLYLAFGHQHLGLTQGAVTARLLTQLVAGQQPDINMQPYCISRFN